MLLVVLIGIIHTQSLVDFIFNCATLVSIVAVFRDVMHSFQLGLCKILMMVSVENEA